MAIRTLRPPPDLEGVIKRFWYTDPRKPYDCRSIRILADGAPGIIFQHHNGHSAVLDAIGAPLPVAFIYGQSTNPCVNHMPVSPFVFGIDLYPAALKRVFGINASLLTNSLVDLEDFAGKKFIDRLLNTPDPTQLAGLFSEFFSQRLSRRQADQLIEESVRRILRNTAEISSSGVASLFYISQRQFQRRFKEHIGVCPETYIRIIRFQKSIQLLQDHRCRRLTDISYSVGYTDQSYFNREFKLFSGYTPKEFAKTLATPQPFNQNSGPMNPLRILSG